jgi:SAM-dependent methyltransferase
MVVPTQYLDRNERYEIWCCPSCGHRSAVGNTAPELLAKIYGGDFHSSSQQQVEMGGSITATRATPVGRNALVRAEWLHDMGLRGRLLDVGAGQGAFVAAALPFFDAAGLELSVDAAEVARRAGLRVDVGDFLRAPAQVSGYDVLTMWDVLAGFTDVPLALSRAEEYLRPGGALIATVPDTSGRAARMLGRYWPLLIPPVNLQFFTPASLRLLLKAAGFSVIRIEYKAKVIALQFLVFKALRSLGVPVYEKLAGVIPRSVNVSVNTGDILTFVARKDGSGG